MIEAKIIEDVIVAFKPLLNHAYQVCGNNQEAIDKFMSQYMYMYTDEKLSYFKHILTREYLKLPWK